MSTRVVFMGSDLFSLPALKVLLSTGERQAAAAIEVVGVVTAPDRPRGRGRHLAMSPVKEVALSTGVPVLQPAKLRDPAAAGEVLALTPDLIVVASYGQFLPRHILRAPAHGALNIHPSLLPRYRGPSPIQGAILAGDPATGVTIMLMNERMDEGAIVAQISSPIEPAETAAELEARLAVMGSELLSASLGPWLKGEIEPQPQDNSRATYTRLLHKEDGHIEWSADAWAIERQVRAYNPWPVAFTSWNGRQLRLLRARATEGAARPGEVVEIGKDGAVVGTGDGLLIVQELQLEGARPLPAIAFARGQRGFAGSVLG